MSRNVFIVGFSGSNNQYYKMFRKAGWGVTDKLDLADLVQFTGGQDVNPDLYGQAAHPFTHFHAQRDNYERIMFCAALKKKIPMVGICRGGQFLHVMCGGDMYQHVDHHALSGTHKALDQLSNKDYYVTSTHHQMMMPNKKASIIMTASESTRKEYMNAHGITSIVYPKGMHTDIEALWYNDEQCLCFQPHPEYHGQSTLATLYFDYIAFLIG